MRKKEKNCLLTRLHGLKCLVLCALFSLLGIANSHAAQEEKFPYEMQDSVVIDIQTLIGLKQKNIFRRSLNFPWQAPEVLTKDGAYTIQEERDVRNAMQLCSESFDL